MWSDLAIMHTCGRKWPPLISNPLCKYGRNRRKGWAEGNCVKKNHWGGKKQLASCNIIEGGGWQIYFGVKGQKAWSGSILRSPGWPYYTPVARWLESVSAGQTRLDKANGQLSLPLMVTIYLDEGTKRSPSWTTMSKHPLLSTKT